MSSNKIHKLKSIFAATAGGGGCGCRPKSADIVEPQSKSSFSSSDKKSSLLPSSSSATSSAAAKSADDDSWSSSSATFPLTASASPGAANCPKIHNSLAVVKDSDDPYHDFRQSMLQMICERKIYSTTDLQQLLDCFLRLNSPRHHEVIVRAFVEIWHGGGGIIDVNREIIN